MVVQVCMRVSYKTIPSASRSCPEELAIQIILIIVVGHSSELLLLVDIEWIIGDQIISPDIVWVLRRLLLVVRSALLLVVLSLIVQLALVCLLVWVHISALIEAAILHWHLWHWNSCAARQSGHLLLENSNFSLQGANATVQAGAAY